ncbi:MAG TPA: sugar ABC transporter permease [Herpetosiphonaceae bacterium]|nr:sugar ABC transporter permease [Herpetosiphonaceae bacterium]
MKIVLSRRATLEQRQARRRINWRGQITAFLFLLPALLAFVTFNWYPMVKAVGYSFQKVKLAGGSTWVGFDNYRRMLGNPLFATAWRNVLEFTVLSVLLGFIIPIIVALMINELRRLGGVFGLIAYLPTLIPVTIALLVWRQLYAPEGGFINSILASVGIPAQLWLQNPLLAKPAMIVIMTWAGVGGTILIYTAALKEIPQELYEAAQLDGFSVWDRIRFIVLPLLASRIAMLLVLQVIFVAQVFAEPQLLTQGGPANSTVTPVLEIYRTAFDRGDYGLASAWSVSLLAVLAVFSIAYVRLSFRNDEASGR